VPTAFSAASGTVTALFSVAEGDGVAEASADASPGVRMSLIAVPMFSSRLPWLAEADGDGAGASVAADAFGTLAEDGAADDDADGAGAALPPAPGPASEVRPDILPAVVFAEADGVGCAATDCEAPAEADGDGVADGSVASFEPVRASTHFWYSSAVRLLGAGWSAARASVELRPMPMRTAVGIAARAIFPAGA